MDRPVYVPKRKRQRSNPQQQTTSNYGARSNNRRSSDSSRNSDLNTTSTSDGLNTASTSHDSKINCYNPSNDATSAVTTPATQSSVVKETAVATSVVHTPSQHQEQKVRFASNHQPHDQNQQDQQQSIHDFMDNADYNEWGGPTSVRNDYVTNSSSLAEKKKDVIHDLFSSTKAASKIGIQLLKCLGWKQEHSTSGASNTITAYVKEDDNAAATRDNDDDDIIYLSKRRIHKIVKTQRYVYIPTVRKLGSYYGLGHIPLQLKRPEDEEENNANNQSTRTTTSGFAYDDDADDGVYDNDTTNENNAAAASTKLSLTSGSSNHGERSILSILSSSTTDMATAIVPHTSNKGKSKSTEKNASGENDKSSSSHSIDKSLYTNEIVSYSSNSDDDDDGTNNKNTIHKEFSNVLSSWTKEMVSTKTTITNTNGVVELPGFNMATTTSTPEVKRFVGPTEIPATFTGRHAFTRNEHPSIYQALAHAEKQFQRQPSAFSFVDTVSGQQQHSQSDAVGTGATTTRTTSLFTNVGIAMKNHFVPSSDTATKDSAEVESSSDSSYFIRTTKQWVPSALLCKRFGIQCAANASSTTISTVPKSREELYFYNEIMPEAQHVALGNKGKDRRQHLRRGRNEGISEGKALLQELSSATSGATAQRRRHDITSVFKSIFEPGDDVVGDDEESSTISNEEENSSLCHAPQQSKVNDNNDVTKCGGEPTVSLSNTCSTKNKDVSSSTKCTMSGSFAPGCPNVYNVGIRRERKKSKKSESRHRRHHKKSKKRKRSSKDDDNDSDTNSKSGTDTSSRYGTSTNRHRHHHIKKKTKMKKTSDGKKDLRRKRHCDDEYYIRRRREDR